jgi:hypothetical protein
MVCSRRKKRRSTSRRNATNDAKVNRAPGANTCNWSCVAMEVIGIFVPLHIYRHEVRQHFGLRQDQSYIGARDT